MAAIALTDVTSALATLFEDEIAQLWNRSVVLSKLIPVKESSAHTINWDVNHTDGALASSSSMIGEGTSVSSFQDDSLTKATLSHAIYYDAFSISNLALASAAATANPAALKNLFGEKLMNSVTRLASNLNKEWYLGTGASNHIFGLVDATNGALKATGTYAGIAKSGNLFAGNELLNGGFTRPLSIQLMRDAVRSIYTACGESPDLIVMDPIQFSRYGMLFGEQRRYMSDMSTAAGSFKLDGGFRALEFDGIPVVQDKDAQAGQVLFLNTRHMSINYLSQAPVMAAPGDNGSALVRLSGTAETQYGAGNTALQARLQPLPNAGDFKQFALFIYTQLVVRHPNSCAILGDLVSA